MANLLPGERRHREKLARLRRQAERKTPSGWKELPATDEQLAALRKMAMESGRTFQRGITRGQAWRRISRATKALSGPERKRCAPCPEAFEVTLAYWTS